MAAFSSSGFSTSAFSTNAFDFDISIGGSWFIPSKRREKRREKIEEIQLERKELSHALQEARRQEAVQKIRRLNETQDEKLRAIDREMEFIRQYIRDLLKFEAELEDEETTLVLLFSILKRKLRLV